MQERIRVISIDDLPTIQFLERKLLADSVTDEMEREMISWNAPWREESARHYLNTGWSVGLFSDETDSRLLGYGFAQMFLFYKNLTQALWVEHIAGVDKYSADIVRETLVKYAKDKHIQSVFIHQKDQVIEIPTTKR